MAIGIDSIDLGLLRMLADYQPLPHLENLLARSRVLQITGEDELRAELPWTTFLTGELPADSGYWGTVSFDPDTYGVRLAGARYARPFFADLPPPVVALDIPHSVPWPGVEGLQVVAWGAHSPQRPRSSEPPELLDMLDAAVGTHPAFEADSEPGWHSADYESRLVDALIVGAGRRAMAFRWLLAHDPQWRSAVVVFSEIHSAGHLFWHAVDDAHPLGGLPSIAATRARFASVAVAVDSAVGSILGALPSGTQTVLFSVHGMMANSSDLVASYLLPELLHRDEFGWSRHGNLPLGGARPVLPPARVALGVVLGAYQTGSPDHRGPLPPSFWELGTERSRRRLRTLRNRPKGPGRALRSVGGPVLASGGRATSLEYLGTMRYRNTWPLGRSFVLPSLSDAAVRVNLRGRERDGVVSAENYSAELHRIEQLLAAVHDPDTGRRIHLHLTRMRSQDPFAADGPAADLLVRAPYPLDAWEHPSFGRIGPFPYLRTGEHRPGGFVAFPPGTSYQPANSVGVDSVSLADVGRVLVAIARSNMSSDLQAPPVSA